MILTIEQAQAIYDSIKSASRIGGFSIEYTLQSGAWVQANSFGGICIDPNIYGGTIESYNTCSEFATAYDLRTH